MYTRSAWAGLLLLAGTLSATTRQPPLADGFERARQTRAALEARPPRERTPRDYAPVLVEYRAVYHANPASPHADASIEAVAELLGERSSLFHAHKDALDAIGQYEFLRREYPGSRYGPGALLAEADLYADELRDRPAAEFALKNFLKQYPHHPLVAEVRTRLRTLGGPALATAAPAGSVLAGSPLAKARKPRSSLPGHERHNAVLAAAIASQAPTSPNRSAPPSPAQTSSSAAHAAPAQSASRTSGFEEHDIPAASPPAPTLPAQTVPASAPTPEPKFQAPTRQAPQVLPAATLAAPPPRHGQLPMVTGVRHWSTPVYTRVAIDLQDEVKYQASRVPNPDRIFFDLHGARLSPELVGRSTQVTDDGYLRRIRAAQFSGDVVRVVLDVSDVSDYSAFFLPNPSRLIIDIHGRAPGSYIRYTTPAAAQAPMPTQAQAAPSSVGATAQQTAPTPAPPVLTKQARTGTVPPRSAAPATTAQQTEIAALDQQPNRVMATKRPTTAPVAASVVDTSTAPQPEPARVATARHTRRSLPLEESAGNTTPVHAAQPTADGERSMVRALGLKIGRIVVDAGHGGHDSGTLGPGGIEEKTVVLDVALRLGRLLKQRLGADVIYTRDDDTFIPLETRTAIANKAQADLFISVHANSSQDSSARGVETYYLNFTTSADALEVAARENAVSDQSIHQLSDLVRKITLQDKIAESREFAADVDQSLYAGLEAGNSGLKDRGVKKAPFVVLIGANMPSILAEISFLTNPDDAHQLSDPEYRQRIAESLYRGVARYVGSLSGVRLASAAGRPSGE